MPFTIIIAIIARKQSTIYVNVNIFKRPTEWVQKALTEYGCVPTAAYVYT